MRNPWKTHMGFLWVQNRYGQKLPFFGHFYLFLDQNSRFVDHHSFGPGEKIIGRPIIPNYLTSFITLRYDTVEQRKLYRAFFINGWFCYLAISSHEPTWVHTSPHKPTWARTSPHQPTRAHMSPHEPTRVHTSPHEHTRAQMNQHEPSRAHGVHTSPNIENILYNFLWVGDEKNDV